MISGSECCDACLFSFFIFAFPGGGGKKIVAKKITQKPAKETGQPQMRMKGENKNIIIFSKIFLKACSRSCNGSGIDFFLKSTVNNAEWAVIFPGFCN
jgi:hypothetical protein